MLDFLFQEPIREPGECIVTVDGEEIADLYPFLSAVEVECSRAEGAVATLTFSTRRDEAGDWAVVDEGILLPWARIVIEAAFGGYTEEVMRGYVVTAKASYPGESCEATYTVQCRDDSLALDREHKRRPWGDSEAPVSDGQILAELLGGYSSLEIRPGADNQEGLSGLVLNQNGTDIDFLRGRAEANGFELLFRGGELYFGPLRLDAEPQPTILVLAGADSHCEEFETEVDGHRPDKVVVDQPPADEGDANQPIEVEAALKLLGSEAVTADSVAGAVPFTWRITRPEGYSEEELRVRAQAAADLQSLKVSATGSLDGSRYGHVLQPGLPVGVDGVGRLNNGIYYVDSVTHHFDGEGYRQSFRLLRNALGDNL